MMIAESFDSRTLANMEVALEGHAMSSQSGASSMKRGATSQPKFWNARLPAIGR